MQSHRKIKKKLDNMLKCNFQNPIILQIELMLKIIIQLKIQLLCNYLIFLVILNLRFYFF
jgi:hypothetical protein